MKPILKPKQITKILLIALLSAIFYFGGTSIIKAINSNLSVDQLNQEKSEKQQRLLELKQKISNLQAQINDQRKAIASLANEIKLFQLQIQQTQEQIQAVNAEIDVVNLDIIDILNQVNDTEEEVGKKKELLTELLQDIYEYDRKSPLELILSTGNFSDILRQLESTKAIQNQNQELLFNLQDLLADLDAKKKLLNENKNQLEELKKQAEAAQQALLAQQAQKANLLSATRGKESRYKALLTEVSEEEAQINREVFELDTAIRKKLGDKSLPTVTGLFAWPMEGILTQGYGNTGFTKMGYTFHNGIDIAAPAGTPIYAAADGVVYATGTGKVAYGNWVAIKHSIQTESNGIKNIITLYAHNSKNVVSAGTTVMKGDMIALEGNTGNTTRILYGAGYGYHLHFGVYDEEGFGIKEGAYPELYGEYRVPYGYHYNPMDFLK